MECSCGCLALSLTRERARLGENVGGHLGHLPSGVDSSAASLADGRWQGLNHWLQSRAASCMDTLRDSLPRAPSYSTSHLPTAITRGLCVLLEQGKTSLIPCGSSPEKAHGICPLQSINLKNRNRCSYHSGVEDEKNKCSQHYLAGGKYLIQI